MISPLYIIRTWLLRMLGVRGFMGRLHLQETVEVKIGRADGRQEFKILKSPLNTITQAGMAEAAGLLGNTGSPVAFTYLAVGTASTAESNAHTALQAEIIDSGLARASATVSRVTTTYTNDTLQLLHQWSVTATKTVEEVAGFNDASAGDMLGRKLTGGDTVNNGDTYQITYKYAVS